MRVPPHVPDRAAVRAADIQHGAVFLVAKVLPHLVEGTEEQAGVVPRPVVVPDLVEGVVQLGAAVEVSHAAAAHVDAAATVGDYARAARELGT